MKENYKYCLEQVLKYEGGKVDHPKDPGGRTAYGVTQRVYTDWLRKHGKMNADVWKITRPEIEAIYRRDYWDRVHGDDLPSGVDLAVFDLAVNSGVGRAAKMLQSVVGVPQDGVIGPATLAAVNAHPNCHNALCSRRLAFLQRLGTWPTFGKGWGARVADVKKKCCALADHPPAPEYHEHEPVEETFDQNYPETWDDFAQVPEEAPTYAPRPEPEYHEPYHAPAPARKAPPPSNLKGSLIAAATATAGALQQSDFVSISDNGYTGLLMVGASIAFAIWQALIPALKEGAEDAEG